jgi:hypothetical protein
MLISNLFRKIELRTLRCLSAGQGKMPVNTGDCRTLCLDNIEQGTYKENKIFYKGCPMSQVPTLTLARTQDRGGPDQLNFSSLSLEWLEKGVKQA